MISKQGKISFIGVLKRVGFKVAVKIRLKPTKEGFHEYTLTLGVTSLSVSTDDDSN